MAKEIILETPTPGRGLFRIETTADPEGDWQLSIRRSSDGQYLGPAETWRNAIHQHPLKTARFDAGVVVLEADTDLIDGIGHCARTNKFQVTATDGMITESATLRINGTLTLKDAGAGPSAGATEAPPEPDPAPESGPETEAQAESAAAASSEELAVESDPTPVEENPVPSLIEEGTLASAPVDEPPQVGGEWQKPKRRLQILLFLLLLLAVAGTLIWTLSQPEKTTDVDAGQSGSDGSAAQSASPAASTSTGRDRARAVLDRGLAPAEIYAEAERADREADCDSALLLYRDAAKDPGSAFRLARRYDPDGFDPSPCITAANLDSAEVNYEIAAKAGDAHAQRRLGEILVDAYPSGPIHQSGIKWLRKAARAEDQKATERLHELGED